MKHAGHKNPGTYRKHYAPNNDTDGQAAYLGKPVRTEVIGIFQDLAIPRNPDLWQSLPADKQFDLEKSEEYREIETRLQALGSSPAAQTERRALHEEKRRLVRRKLRECRKQQQPSRPLSGVKLDSIYEMGHHRPRFARARRMMPERDRLATNLFEEASLRSDVGLQCLRDMVALCRQKHDIKIRLGLEPDKCHCGKRQSRFAHLIILLCRL